MKTTRRTVSIDSDVSERAVAQAVAENRTLSNFVNTLLRARFSTPTGRKASKKEVLDFVGPISPAAQPTPKMSPKAFVDCLRKSGYGTEKAPTRRKASKKEVPV